jgi:hypothetical protein
MMNKKIVMIVLIVGLNIFGTMSAKVSKAFVYINHAYLRDSAYKLVTSEFGLFAAFLSDVSSNRTLKDLVDRAVAEDEGALEEIELIQKAIETRKARIDELAVRANSKGTYMALSLAGIVTSFGIMSIRRDFNPPVHYPTIFPYIGLGAATAFASYGFLLYYACQLDSNASKYSFYIGDLERISNFFKDILLGTPVSTLSLEKSAVQGK